MKCRLDNFSMGFILFCTLISVFCEMHMEKEEGFAGKESCMIDKSRRDRPDQEIWLTLQTKLTDDNCATFSIQTYTFNLLQIIFSSFFLSDLIVLGAKLRNLNLFYVNFSQVHSQGPVVFFCLL